MDIQDRYQNVIKADHSECDPCSLKNHGHVDLGITRQHVEPTSIHKGCPRDVLVDGVDVPLGAGRFPDERVSTKVGGRRVMANQERYHCLIKQGVANH